ncbi:MAG: DNA-processing protein DprA [Planctomycetota bacterium]
MSEREILIALNLADEIGPRTVSSLFSAVPEPQALLRLPPERIAECAGLPLPKAQVVADALRSDAFREEERLAAERSVNIICQREAAYPEPLRHIADPPIVLYLRGDYRPTDAVALAIVGARRASAYGVQFARRLAADLASCGFTVVSGLARGIDAAAHHGALDAGGRTLAVCGCGLSSVYPLEHRELADRIIAAGALLTEFPMRFPVRPENFPRRNRIISGLCLGVVVVEAAQRSGSLITARHAFEQGREVFAVPGRAGSPSSRGAHALIKDGAKLVDGIEDILEEFPDLARTLQGPDAPPRPALKLTDAERKVFDAVSHDPADAESLAAATGLPIRDVLASVSMLSIKKLIVPAPGGMWVRRL